eukprot:2925965-Pyramimonas_sp.AAC.1
MELKVRGAVQVACSVRIATHNQACGPSPAAQFTSGRLTLRGLPRRTPIAPCAVEAANIAVERPRLRSGAKGGNVALESATLRR